MKEELLQIFPTPLLIVPYEQSIDEELAYLKTILLFSVKLGSIKFINYWNNNMKIKSGEY